MTTSVPRPSLWRRVSTRVLLIAAVIAVVVIAAGAVVVGRDAASQSGCAEMSDSIGLYPGNNVTLLGVKIGTVSSITPDDGHVRVNFSMDSSMTFPADVAAITTSDSIVTDRRLEIPKSYVGGAKWDMRTCIPLDRTRTPKSLSAAFTAFNKLAKQVTDAEAASPGQSQAVKTALADVDDSLKGTGADFNDAVKGLAAALGDPTLRDEQLRSLVTNFSELSDFFVDKWPDVKLALDNLGKFSIAFRDLAGELNPSLITITRVTPKLQRLVQTYAPPVFSILDPIVPLADNIPTDKIVALLKSLPPVTSAINKMAAQQEAGLSVTIKPPRLRVPVASSAVACAALNRMLAGSCRPTPGSPGTVDASLIQIILGSVGAR